MKVYNRTEFTQEDIDRMELIKCGRNNWRQRSIRLYQHPTRSDLVISVGDSFDGSQRIIAEETKLDWRFELMVKGDFVTN